tara:strand:- start:324 stop:611 length:288 start_codon:yes stop_codon:yes gene_type:complete
MKISKEKKEDYFKLIEKFVDKNIKLLFHDKRMEALSKQNPKQLLTKILSNKNPYLFYSLNITTAEGFISRGLGDFKSSSDEGIFGKMLETMTTRH